MGDADARSSVGVSMYCPKFLSTPYYLRNGYSYGLQIWPVHSQSPSEQKPTKNLEKMERRHIQGLPDPSVFNYPHYLRNG